MAISLNKDVDKIYVGLLAAMEALGPLTAQQQDMLQQGLEFTFKKGYEIGRDSK